MPQRLCKIELKEKGIAILEIPGSEATTERQLLEAIRRQITHITDTSEIKGVIVTSSDSHFCTCGIQEYHPSPYTAAELSSFGQQVTFLLEKTGKPCIAAIAGECTGVGLELALACDFIVAESSARFGFPGIEEGRLPFCGGTQRLSRLVGKSKAKEMVFGGELLSAEEGLAIGLINRLYDDNLLSHAQALLEKICTRSPLAIRIGGEVINAGYDIDLQTACMLERDAFALIFSSHDQSEGMQAFLDKRNPDFKGN
ncbi:enoyl-CoA hydratase/isomerase family protein [Pelotalea chapellei]|uniref:Enoyl-CoA hydratase/isomerase family protein n=1 Tax=Pelotalea chapellei TaxID=44671 RepID=A0ABS5U8K2_9BACT|nr:enoyl-CoA hydratase-related protein [Pelotalea chapellei]MBT1071994.1 enoyl-CoA hydratase/isomerase family protein [Pelotalea chapellei]